MLFLIIILFLILVIILIKRRDEVQSSSTKTGFKKVLISIGLFIALFYAYAMAIGIFSMIPLYLIDRKINTSSTDSGIWAYGLILAICVSPILSLITTSKMMNKKPETKKHEEIKLEE